MSSPRSARLPWPKKSLHFQLMSDLHLEVGPQYSKFDISPQAPYLILAGDIGRLLDYDLYLNFLITQCNRFLLVFLVLGNHEFYGDCRSAGLRRAAQLEQEALLQGRLVILNRRRVDVSDSVTIIGCTLHSNISLEHQDAVKSKVKDFKRIDQWTVADHNAEHNMDLEWLRKQVSDIQVSDNVESKSRRKIIVVSHHAPIRRGSSHPNHEDHSWSDAFATELICTNNSLSVLSNVEWWIFGHTHYTTTCSRGGVKLISNQRGYILPQREGCIKEDCLDMTLGRWKSAIQLLLGRPKHQFNPRRSIKV